MDREQARAYIQARATDYLKPDRSGKGYICPICGSGTGKAGTGITTKDKIHYTCWAGCFSSADIIDIIGLENGLEDYNSKLQRAADIYGITIDGRAGVYQKQNKNEQSTQHSIHNSSYTITQQETEPDYTGFILQAAENIDKTEYHRGLSSETLKRFKIGYVENYSGDNKAAKGWNALIIPTTKHSYVIRNTDSSSEERYRNQGTAQLFNSRALTEARKPIIIVEGEIDAMSIYDVGGEALGLGSLNNYKKLLSVLEENKPAQPLVIALDNEAEPEKAAKVERAVAELENGFKQLEIAYYRADISGIYKDANEALNADREAFKAAVEEAENREIKQLRLEAVKYSIQDFLDNISRSETAPFYSTGFPNIDRILDGGLYAGLYVVGAISSLGKTTFCLQIADEIAKSGKNVLIFSLEMARDELIAKSISRLTYLEDYKKYGTTVHAKTTRGILTGRRYKDYSRTETELIITAIEEYKQYAERIYITEGIGNVGVKEIREKIQKYIRLTGEAPVVIIDYLQILTPADLRATDKQNTDRNITELKRLSRDYKIPIIGISSLNRENYTAPVNLAGFKESGSIEYSSDVLIGLQYAGMDYQEDEGERTREKRVRELMKQTIADAKNGKPQKIEIKILKNRNGSKGETLLDFYPMFNYFTEPVEDEEENGGGWKIRKSNYGKPKFTDITDDTEELPL